MVSNARLRYLLIMRALLLLCTLSLLWISCESEAPVVEAVAHAYLKARLGGDFATASEWVAANSQDRLEDLELLVITGPAEARPDSFSIEEIRIRDGYAAVIYDLAGFGGDTLDLVKGADGWQVDLTAESAVPDAGVLWQELKELEMQDTVSRDLRAMDHILFEEDSLVQMLDSTGLADDSL